MSVATIVLAFSAGLSGFAALSLGMDRHYEDCFGRGADVGRKRPWLRLAGTLGLALSLWASLVVDGRSQGWVLWLGALTASALVVVGFSTFRPGQLVRLLGAATALAVVSGVLALVLVLAA